jgi:hypothetical protein
MYSGAETFNIESVTVGKTLARMNLR